MKRKRSSDKLRDWLFARMVRVLTDGEWIIMIKNSHNSNRKNERGWCGLTSFHDRTIFLDYREGVDNVSTLCHELGHVVFQEILEKEGRKISKRERRGIKGRAKYAKWAERRVAEFERCFFNSLSSEQKKILEMFIDEARKGT